MEKKEKYSTQAMVLSESRFFLIKKSYWTKNVLKKSAV